MNARLVLLFAFAGTLAAADHGIRVEATSPWSDAHGYTPVIVTVSSPKDAEVDVLVQAIGPTARTTIRAPEGRQVRQTVLVPPASQDWFSLNQVEWSDASGARGTVSISGRGHSSTRAFLVDPDQKIELPKLQTALSGVVATSSRGSRTDLLGRVDLDDLPDRWQGYPDWLVLVLTPKGDAGLDDAQRAAITAWVQSGGTLVVSTAELVRAWEGHGVRVVFDALTGDAKALGKTINEQDGAERWAPESAPVPGTETVPVKTFVFLALAFAIVVGPLNLWWVRRRNARHLFLITTPAVSFVTCVALIVASLVSDGVSVKRSAIQVCYLDHRSQQMVRWTGCTYFAAFSRSWLPLDGQTKVHVLDPDLYDASGYGSRRHSYGVGPALNLDWRQGQILSGVVIPARLNRQLSYTEQLPERRRLVIERDGAGYRVANGLGVQLLGLRWRDAQGQAWSCNTVASGETAALVAVATGVENTLALDATADSSSLNPTGPLPPTIGNRIGRDVTQAYDRLREQPLTFTATLAAPMDALPGPESIDPKPPIVIAFGHLPLGSAGAGSSVGAAP
jgi:hypothetical protein